MKRRVCCLLLGICMLCLPVQQVYAAPAVGPAAEKEEKEKPVPPHEHKHPLHPHEHKHKHPKPHELKGPLEEKPVPPVAAEKPIPPHEKENAEKEEVTVTPKPTQPPVQNTTTTDKNNTTGSATNTTTGTSSAKGIEVVKYALQFLGNPYKYGGTSLTSGADCSGFVQSVYKHFGYELDRNSRSQAVTAGYMDVTPNLSQLQPGDLIFYADSSGGVFHVAIYIGDGGVVHAANSRKGITISEYDYMKPYKARRVVK